MTAPVCAYCGRDRGRRPCPALGGPISPSCCGRHRGVEIDCPSHCRYFKEHEEYQRRRLSPEFQRAWLEAMEPFYRERADDLFDFEVFLERILYAHYALKPRGTDVEVLQALESLRTKLGPIAVAAVETPPTEAERHLLEAVDEYMERVGRPAPEDARRAVEALITVVKTLQDPDGREPRRALHGLLGHVEQFLGVPPEIQRAQEEQERLIETPKILRPED